MCFHQCSEQYLNRVPNWNKGSELSTLVIPNEVTELEAMVHEHQSLYEQMCQVYNEVHVMSKKLLYQLDHFIQLCHQYKVPSDSKHIDHFTHGINRSNSAADYQEGAKHIVSIVHDVLSQHRCIENLWHAKKIKLHQRLALALFQEDVRQVIEWIDSHGEGFLRKNVGIGRNLLKARALHKSHEHFETVAQNTYTNAEKLLAAADELAQTGECNAVEICGVAQELEAHISNFALRVDRRRQLLHLAVMFYTHEKELLSWFEELQQEFQPERIEAPESLEAVESALAQLVHQRDSMVEAAASTIAEGETILTELKSHNAPVSSGSNVSNGVNDCDPVSTIASSIAAVEASLEKLKRIRSELEELWKTRKVRLDLCLKLRAFERAAVDVSTQFDLWADEIQRLQQKQTVPVDIATAEKLLQLHSESFTRHQQMAFDLLQRGQELNQVCYLILLVQRITLFLP